MKKSNNNPELSDIVEERKPNNWLNRLGKGVRTAAFYTGLGVVALTGCSDSESKDNNPDKIQLVGGVQKGPFLQGSKLDVKELDLAGDPTGKIFSGIIKNNVGDFDVTVSATGTVEMEGSGFHFNEATGQLSGAQLTLKSLYVIPTDTPSSDAGVDSGLDSGTPQNAVTPNVNILTHLSYLKEKADLKAGTYPTANETILEAEKDLRSKLSSVIKHQDEQNAGFGSDSGLYNGDNPDSNYLSALSCMLTGAAEIKARDNPKGSGADAILQDMINRIALAGQNGTAIPVDILALLDKARTSTDPAVCKANLEKRLTDTGLTGYTVADPSKVWDTDNDGTPNYTDNDDDGDGVLDVDDIAPLVPTKGLKEYCKGSLCWEINPSQTRYTASEINGHCDKLDLAGHTDWRVPTIDELRSLVTGCVMTGTGGACGITDATPESTDYNALCKGCGTDTSCYSPTELNNPCGTYVSSTRQADGYLWTITFDDASVASESPSSINLVRCVRDK